MNPVNRYYRIAGTSYPKGLPRPAATVLEIHRETERRVRLVYSDGRTQEGYVGRSCGNPAWPQGGIKAALILHNRRSPGGFPIDRDLVRIERTRKPYGVLWTRERDASS